MDTKASQGDGSKRRSFLPAPKRATESQFSTQQAGTNSRMIQSQLPILQPTHAVYPREPSQIPSFAAKQTLSSVGFREQTGALPRASHFMERPKEERAPHFMERPKEESSFGTGLHVGARVKIGGVKPGILRYLGPTHLAPGIFCGIELLDPDGNHNGEVNGHRYFFCLPNHGIFAPKEKVCLDTSDDLGSLVVDSDSYYSSHDKRHRPHKNYAEGEFNSRSSSKSSNLTNPYGTQYVEDATHSQRYRDTEGGRKSNLPSQYITQEKRPYNSQSERFYNTQSERPPNTHTGRSETLQSYGYNEPLHQLPHSGVPSSGRSSVSSTSSQPRLPNYSRAYTKYNDEFHPGRSPAYSSQSDSSQNSSYEALTDLRDSVSDFETHQGYDRSSPAYTNYRANPDRTNDSSQMEDMLNTDIKHQLRADSRQYLNFTFNSDDLNMSREYEERESDSSFLDDEYEAKYGNTVHENYRKYTGADSILPGNIQRNVSSAVDKVNRQQYHELSAKVDGHSSLPTADDVGRPRREPVRSERLDAGMSESYIVFRAGLDAANSGPGGEGNSSNTGASLASRGLDGREGSGLFTGVHTYKDERISTGGYVVKNNSDDKYGGGSQVFPFDRQDSPAKSAGLQGRRVGGIVKDGGNSGRKIEPRSGTSMDKPKGDNTESRTGLCRETKGDNIEENVNGPSPEVTQTLEWDYGQEFEGNRSASSSTGTSESFNDGLRDMSDDGSSVYEGDMASGVTDDSEHEFESIDELSFFSKGANHASVRSRKLENSLDGCSVKYPSVGTRESSSTAHPKRGKITSMSSDSSQETLVAECIADTPGSIEERNILSGDLKDVRSTDSLTYKHSISPGPVIHVEEYKTMQNNTHECKDEEIKQRVSSLQDTASSSDSSVVAKSTATCNRSKGRNSQANYNEINILGYDIQGTVVSRNERPLSLLSTSSTDTGYVPDIDSELGALISSTSGGDWVDRCGVSHPTTHAPLDGHETTDTEREDKDTIVKTTASLTSKTAVKAKDDDDCSSDLTGNAEDDRVEADRLDSQESKAARGAREPVSIDVSNKEDSDRKHNEESLTPETSPESPKIEDFHGKDGKTEDTTPEGKGKPRKPIVITKKRSENVDHKMPNINVTSRLADYIKAPVPVKPKEEKEKEIKKKHNKNVKNINESSTKYKQEASRAPSEDGEHKAEEKLEKPKPIIKRERPKSKWDNIMCQIETNKDTVKVKPITEVKSSLAEYLHSPLPQLPSDDAETMPSHPRKEFKSKLKQLPPPPPKIDLSKVKSKLNVPTAASAIKTLPKREKPAKTGNLKIENRASRGSSTALNAELATPENNGHARKMSDSSSVDLQLPTGTSQTDLGVSENKDGSVQPPGKEGISSKSSPGDTKKDSHRSSIHSVKLESTEKHKSSADQGSKSGESIKKATQSTAHQSKKVVPSAPKVTRNAISNNIRSSRSTGKNVTKKEFEQLELLYEARADEVVQLKTQLDAAIQAFDAMAVLANYCSNELNAFECPTLSRKLEAVQRQLEEYAQQIVELNSQKATLDKDLNQMMQEKEQAARQTKEAQDSAQKQREEHVQMTHDLSGTHMTALSTQRDELSAKHEETLNKLTQFYETQLEMQRQAHERQISDIMNECKLEINSLKISNLEEIQELRNKHDDQMEELHKQHRNKMEDISLRFEAIKFALSEKVDCLRKECDDLAVRARNSEEALQKDADFKVRIALAPYLNLPSEIESLKSIQGMRLEEIQKLRTKIMDLEKQLEEVPIGREKIISLQQKIENLEAIINIKTEHEKQLHQRCQVLMRKYDRESRANKRISMDFEQIMWRMSQSADFDSCDSLKKQQLSQSQYDRAPDSLRHSTSPNRDASHHVRKRSSTSVSEGDRKLRSRSASFVPGINDGSCDTTSSSGAHPKLGKHSRKSHIAENEHFNRMCQSAGPEVMFELLADHSCPQTQLDRHEEQTVTESQGTSSSDMTISYARSLSGVTDSGVYDSLTRSDVFNSSTASTDLDLGASVNLSVTCDSAAEDAHESGPLAGDYHLV